MLVKSPTRRQGEKKLEITQRQRDKRLEITLLYLSDLLEHMDSRLVQMENHLRQVEEQQKTIINLAGSIRYIASEFAKQQTKKEGNVP